MASRTTWPKELHIFDFFAGPGKSGNNEWGTPLLVLDEIKRTTLIQANAYGWKTRKIHLHLFDLKASNIVKLKKNTEKNLKEIQTTLKKAGIKNVTTNILEGDARDKIVSVAKKEACDLIIMSTHGRSGIRRALLGSVAEDVVRHAPCPVLLIREKK